MTYHLTTRTDLDFDQALDRVTDLLAEKGFGIMTTIDVQKALKEKLGQDFRRYTILGACNPGYAHQALQLEDKIGTMLPCNVVVQEVAGGTEVSAVDPLASMQAVQNGDLRTVAGQVSDLLQDVIDRV